MEAYKAEGGPPGSVIWLVTSACNMNCMHCYVSRWRGRLRELGSRERMRLAEEMVDAGVDWVAVTGGEPLILPDIWDVLRLLSRGGVEVGVNTNALLLDAGRAAKLSSHVSTVYVSIDGSRETHEAMRRCRGCYARVVEAVKTLTRVGVEVVPVMAVSRINAAAVKNYIGLAADMGLGEAAIIPVMPQGEAIRTGIWVDAQTYNRAVVEAAAEARERGVRLWLWCTPYAPALRLPADTVTYTNCRLSDTVDLDPAGGILLCDVLDIVLADAAGLGFTRAAEEAESHPLTRLVERPELTGPCRSCPYRWECLGGCYARSLIIRGGLNAGDPLCPLAGGAAGEDGAGEHEKDGYKH